MIRVAPYLRRLHAVIALYPDAARFGLAHLGDRRLILVERSGCDGAVWLTVHPDLEDACRYASMHDYADRFAPVEAIDLRDGQRIPLRRVAGCEPDPTVPVPAPISPRRPRARS